VKNSLITDAKPHGTITINDRGLTRALLDLLVIDTRNTSLFHRYPATFVNNTSAIAWAYKLRNSSSIIAGHLFIISNYSFTNKKIRTHSSPYRGENNIMVDTVSRALKNGKFFQASTNIVSYFNKSFALQQNTSWDECHIPTE